MDEPEKLGAERLGGEEVKIYASDEGHRTEPRPAPRERAASMVRRCREQVVQRPWSALGVTLAAGAALGALAGFCARGSRGR